MRRVAPAVALQQPHCDICNDFGYIGDLKSVGADPWGHTYVELTDAVKDHRIAFCGCPSGDFQRDFLKGMNS